MTATKFTGPAPKHHKGDACEKQRCRECGKAFRCEHECGVWCCSTCGSIDMRMKGKPGQRYRQCGNCGLGTPVFRSVKDRLAQGL